MRTVEEFATSLIDEVKKEPKLIEEEFKKYCSGAKTKQQRLVSFILQDDDYIFWLWVVSFFFRLIASLICIFQCYYLGGLETSATSILGELSKPLSWSMPALKICEKLKKKDGQICDLRFGE